MQSKLYNNTELTETGTARENLDVLFYCGNPHYTPKGGKTTKF